MTPSDKIRSRTVINNIKLIQEHLEAMQRDTYGLEFSPWKREVDGMWKGVFGQISEMSSGPQKTSLESIRELWTTYLQHYTPES